MKNAHTGEVFPSCNREAIRVREKKLLTAVTAVVTALAVCAVPAYSGETEEVETWGTVETEPGRTADEGEIIYEFGDEEEILPYSTFRSWVTENPDGTVSVDREEAREYVEDLAGEYDTAWVDRTFISDDGMIYKIPAGSNTYGFFIDVEAETDALVQDVAEIAEETEKDISREPVYSQTGHVRNGKDDLCGTYIEVDITNQEVTCYRDGILIDKTSCVSGNEGAGTPSDTGTFCIFSKQRDTVLRGQNRDGSWYASPVSYWMPYNGGEGLHDATWRWEFGGDIYKWGGSHGCINLKLEDAKAIYENTDMWTPVIVHK